MILGFLGFSPVITEFDRTVFKLSLPDPASVEMNGYRSTNKQCKKN